MRLSDLNDKRVRSAEGKSLGRVHEVHCKDDEVVALKVGPASFIERMTARTHGRRIDWKCVRKVEPKEIIVALDALKRKKR